MSKEVNKGGKPRKYPNPEGMEAKIEEYFEWMKTETITVVKPSAQGPAVAEVQKPLTVEGLSSYLGICRKVFWEYGKRDGYRNIISAAKEKILAQQLENALVGAGNATVSIFLAKCNHGYIEESKQTITHQGNEEKPVSFNLEGMGKIDVGPPE